MRTSRGFTLIEILVVISIISLLASTVLASLNSARIRAVNIATVVEMHEYITALRSYYLDHNDFPHIGSAALNYDMNILHDTDGFVCLGKAPTGTFCGPYPDDPVLDTIFSAYIPSVINPNRAPTQSGNTPGAYYECVTTPESSESDPNTKCSYIILFWDQLGITDCAGLGDYTSTKYLWGDTYCTTDLNGSVILQHP